MGFHNFLLQEILHRLHHQVGFTYPHGCRKSPKYLFTFEDIYSYHVWISFKFSCMGCTTVQYQEFISVSISKPSLWIMSWHEIVRLYEIVILIYNVRKNNTHQCFQWKRTKHSYWKTRHMGPVRAATTQMISGGYIGNSSYHHQSNQTSKMIFRYILSSVCVSD